MDTDKISVLIERLSIINTKMFFFENEKRKQGTSDEKFLELQKMIDNLNAERMATKNALDKRLSEAIKNGYNPFLEERYYEK